MFSSYILCTNFASFVNFNKKKSTPCLLCSFSTKAFKKITFNYGFQYTTWEEKTQQTHQQ